MYAARAAMMGRVHHIDHRRGGGEPPPVSRKRKLAYERIKIKADVHCTLVNCALSWFGLLLVTGGVAMSVCAYYSAQLSSISASTSSTNTSNSTMSTSQTFEYNTALEETLANLAYVGPFFIGIGSFALMCAYVTTFEARDQASRIIPVVPLRKEIYEAIKNQDQLVKHVKDSLQAQQAKHKRKMKRLTFEEDRNRPLTDKTRKEVISSLERGAAKLHEHYEQHSKMSQCDIIETDEHDVVIRNKSEVAGYPRKKDLQLRSILEEKRKEGIQHSQSVDEPRSRPSSLPVSSALCSSCSTVGSVLADVHHHDNTPTPGLQTPAPQIDPTLFIQTMEAGSEDDLLLHSPCPYATPSLVYIDMSCGSAPLAQQESDLISLHSSPSPTTISQQNLSPRLSSCGLSMQGAFSNQQTQDQHHPSSGQFHQQTEPHQLKGDIDGLHAITITIEPDELVSNHIAATARVLNHNNNQTTIKFDLRSSDSRLETESVYHVDGKLAVPICCDNLERRKSESNGQVEAETQCRHSSRSYEYLLSPSVNHPEIT